MKLNHKQLTFAREYRGYSQTELAAKIKGLAQSNLSKFEKGVSTLSDELFNKTIQFLNFPEAFFYKKITNNIETANYRKRATINKKTKSQIEYSIRLIGYLVDQMSDSLEWPLFTFKQLDLNEGFTVEYVAQYTRKLLRLDPNEPVRNINYLLESNGVLVVEYDAPEKFDGVSYFSDRGTPIIIINSNFDNDRKRFTLAHELGHLLMHNGDIPIPDYRDRETEANRFAAEFLMPEAAIKSSLRNLKLSSLAELKRYWLTSMASIIWRAKDLGCINSERSKYLNIELSRNGEKKSEKLKVFIDSHRLFFTGYRMHREELNYSDTELADAFSIPEDIVKIFFKSPENEGKLKVVI